MKSKFVLLSVLLCLILVLSACAVSETPDTSPEPPDELAPLPPPEPDGGPFGVDVSINMNTIDDFLNRPEVAYVDVRMLYDPADFEAIGGISNLTSTLPGYRIVPFPFLATLSAMPVEGAYEGVTLFDVVWGDNREVLEIKANFAESELILSECFPKDKIIFLMCGGAGYSSLTRALLIDRGWDESRIYHTGGNWHYEGNMALDMTVAGNNSEIATWRVNYALIDFENLTRLAP